MTTPNPNRQDDPDWMLIEQDETAQKLGAAWTYGCLVVLAVVVGLIAVTCVWSFWGGS